MSHHPTLVTPVCDVLGCQGVKEEEEAAEEEAGEEAEEEAGGGGTCKGEPEECGEHPCSKRAHCIVREHILW